jgi:hypothetical protein
MKNLVLIVKAKETFIENTLINNTAVGLYTFDSAEALDAARKEQEEQGKTFIYNHTNRESRYFFGNFC